MSNDPYADIRAEVAVLLKLDLNSLTTHERIRLDLASALKFEFEALVAKLKVGGLIDHAKLAEVAASLERLLPAAGATTPGSSASRRKLEERIIKRIEAEEVEAQDRAERRDEEMEAKDAEIVSLKAQLAEARNAVSIAVALPPSEDQTKPLPQTSSQPPLPHKDAPIPQSYLKRENPWDPYSNRLDTDPGWMLCDRWGKVGSR